MLKLLRLFRKYINPLRYLFAMQFYKGYFRILVIMAFVCCGYVFFGVYKKFDNYDFYAANRKEVFEEYYAFLEWRLFYYKVMGLQKEDLVEIKRLIDAPDTSSAAKKCFEELVRNPRSAEKTAERYLQGIKGKELDFIHEIYRVSGLRNMAGDCYCYISPLFFSEEHEGRYPGEERWRGYNSEKAFTIQHWKWVRFWGTIKMLFKVIFYRGSIAISAWIVVYVCLLAISWILGGFMPVKHSK